jgi:uncharacterized RDD family membrane protein YckC
MRETQETAAGKAVYFDPKDYAGPIRRITILGIDLVALIAIAFGAAYGVVVWRPTLAEESIGKVLLLMLLAGYVYLTFVQRSRVGTLGYLLTGVRIVDVEGRRPSLLQMTVRLIPMLPVPWSLLFDLGWMLDDPRRQTLRDKWAGTFVIRRRARPLGRTTVTYKRVYFSGLQFIIPEIGRHDTSTEPPTPPGPPTLDSMPVS